jgi:hypothetical protein
MMKKMKKLLLGLLSLTFIACTDLNLSPEDAFVDAVVFDDPEAYRSYLAKIYGAFSLTGQDGPHGDGDISIVSDEGFTSYIRSYWKAQELTTDEAIIAWTDAGIRDMNVHSWSSENQFVRVLYYRIFYIIAYSNDFLFQSTPDKLDEHNISDQWKQEIAVYRAEARFLRALAYWHALDLFRNVPILTTISTDLPSQATPQELFNFIESELNDIESTMVDARANEYGRADKAALWMLQAKLYLNAEVYGVSAKYTEALTALNNIINAGYSLAPNYFELFMADNDVNPASNEIIFALNSDGKNTQNWGNTTFLVHAAIGGTMNAPDYGVGSGWGGTRTTKAMVEKFERPGVVLDTADLSTMDPRNIFYTDGQSIDIDDIGRFEDGWAVPKFTNMDSGGNAGQDLDFVDTDNPIFRLGDVYLMYAEAVLRGGSGGDATTALGYINMLRERAYGDTSGNITAGELTLDFILDERVREMYWEATRRVDLIRFGKYTGGSYLWPWKGGDANGVSISDHYEIFPIPASDLNVNSKLKQNDGY